MPRAPDPELEKNILAAATRLLDRGGESAITLRAVAKEAGTTTPTIYERFPDRDALIGRLLELLTNQVLEAVAPRKSVEEVFREFLRFNCPRPMRFNLMVDTFVIRMVGGEKMPVYGLLKSRISRQLDIRGRKCEALALAITSLALGTVRGMIAAGSDTKQASALQRSSIGALRLLLTAFSAAATGRKRARRRTG